MIITFLGNGWRPVSTPSRFCIRSHLYRVLEPSQPLDEKRAVINLSIANPEIDGHDSHGNENQDVAHDDRPHAWSIAWRVLAPEDQRARDAADTAESHERSAAEGTFPLSSDVVRLSTAEEDLARLIFVKEKKGMEKRR